MQLISVIKQIAVTAALVSPAIACKQDAAKEKVKTRAVTPSVRSLANSIANYPTVHQEVVGIASQPLLIGLVPVKTIILNP